MPCLALFGASRFTAIVAAVVFAAPVAIKMIADGIRGVSPTTVEAARAAGSPRLADDHQGAAADGAAAVVLASNQGLLYVLSMVVIGGLVGAGALGYDVVAGFSQGSCSARVWPQASPSCCSGSCSTASPSTPRRRYGRR